MHDYWPEVLALVVFVGAAAFFAASEAAIVSVSKITARTLAEKNTPGAKRLVAMLDDRNRTLTTVLIASRPTCSSSRACPTRRCGRRSRRPSCC
jgi:Mg2+/Co2+ transporter CorB